jgi:hypothetical protein
MTHLPHLAALYLRALVLQDVLALLNFRTLRMRCVPQVYQRSKRMGEF